MTKTSNNASDNASYIVTMMLAMDKNKLIGKEGGMPWKIPGEMAYFKEVTMGKPVIMGRITFDSIGKPLTGRPNFVVTRNADWTAEGVRVCTSLEKAIDGAKKFYKEREAVLATSVSASDSTQPQEVMVIGGAGLCREAMPITQRIYLTLIDHEYEGDIWFDSFDWDDWQIKSRKDLVQDGLAYSYLVLERPTEA